MFVQFIRLFIAWFYGQTSEAICSVFIDVPSDKNSIVIETDRTVLDWVMGNAFKTITLDGCNHITIVCPPEVNMKNGFSKHTYGIYNRISNRNTPRNAYDCNFNETVYSKSE